MATKVLSTKQVGNMVEYAKLVFESMDKEHNQFKYSTFLKKNQLQPNVKVNYLHFLRSNKNKNARNKYNFLYDHRDDPVPNPRVPSEKVLSKRIKDLSLSNPQSVPSEEDLRKRIEALRYGGRTKRSRRYKKSRKPRRTKKCNYKKCNCKKCNKKNCNCKRRTRKPRKTKRR